MRPSKEAQTGRDGRAGCRDIECLFAIYSTTKTKRRSEELTRHRQKARPFQHKPRSPSSVALPTPSSVKEEYIKGDNTDAAEKPDNELARLRMELVAKDGVRDVTPPCVNSETSTLTRTYTSDYRFSCQVASGSSKPCSMPSLS